MMDWQEIKEQLSASSTNVKWRMGNTFKSKGRYFGNVYAYIEVKDIEDKLDNIVGPNNWKNEFKAWHEIEEYDKYNKEKVKKYLSQLCGISIYDEGKKEWITKWDGAQNKDIEGIKSGLTDSIKRAAAQWGIGRDVYAMPQQVVEIYENKHNAKDEQKFVGKLEKGGNNVYNYYWQYPQIINNPNNIIELPIDTAGNNSTGASTTSNKNSTTSGENNNIHSGKLIKADVRKNGKGGQYVLCAIQEKPNFTFNFISNDMSIIQHKNKNISVEIKQQGTYNILQKMTIVA